MNTFREIMSWLGALAVLAAYFLVLTGFLQPDNYFYLILNGAGSLAILATSLHKKDYQPAILNVIWFGIAAAGIIRLAMGL